MSSVSSATSSSAAYYASQKSMFSKLDTDQDGKLTKDEFVAGRPKGVSESRAAGLYSKIDTENSNAVDEDQFNDSTDSNNSGQGIQSLLSGDAMAVLMLMSQQGGMSFDSGTGGAGGQSVSVSDLYADMDADGDGAVTQAEFVAARPDDVSEDDANAFYSSIDTEGTGSITEEQFADSLQASSPGRGMPPHGAGGASHAEEVYDALDTNKDGVVSEDEFLAGEPDEASAAQATSLFGSADTGGTDSATDDQSGTVTGASDDDSLDLSPNWSVNVSKNLDDLLDMLQSLSSGSETAASATEAA